jgi:hypothetical protein
MRGKYPQAASARPSAGPPVQAAVTGGIAAPAEIAGDDLVAAADALRDVVAGELDVDACDFSR